MNSRKQEIRAMIRARKQAMLPADIAIRSQKLCDLVLQTGAYRNAASVYGYLPFNQEVDLLPLLHQALRDGKQVALPKCCGQKMHFIQMQDFSQIRYTAFGVPEPSGDSPLAADDAALVIVPGLAFDRRGYRIGYGGGFYDRFLTAEPNHPTIGLCYDFQLLDRLEPDPQDVPVSAVFSI